MRYFKRAIITFVPIILIVFGVKSYITTKNFPETLNKIIYDSGIADIKIGDIEIEGFREIKIHDVVVNDLNGSNVLEAPLIKVGINIFMPSKIPKIDVYDATINLVRGKSEHYNIYDILKKGKEKNNIDRASRIGYIDIHNSTLNFTDTTFTNEINQTLKSVEGFVEVTKSKGFNIYAIGNIVNDEGVELEHSSMSIDLKNLLHTNQSIRSLLDVYKNNENYRKDFSLDFNFSNVPINEELGQYTYLKILDVKDGILNGNLKLTNRRDDIEKPTIYDIFQLFRKDPEPISSPMRFYGNLSLKDATVFYEEYSEDIHGIDGTVVFDGRLISVLGEVQLDEINNEKDTLLNLSYDLDESIFKMDLNVKNVEYEKLSKYSILDKLNVNVSGYVTGNISLENNQKEQTLKLNGQVNSPIISIDSYNFKNVKANLNMKDNIFKMSDIIFDFKQNVSNIDFDVGAIIDEFKYDTNTAIGTLEYRVNNKNSDIKIGNIKGNAIIKNGIVNSNFTSNQMNGKFVIDTNKKYFIVDGKVKNSLEVVYDNSRYIVENGEIEGLKINFPDQGKSMLSSGKMAGNIKLLDIQNIDSIQANIIVNDGILKTNAIINSLGEQLKLQGTTTESMKHSYVLENYDHNFRIDKFVENRGAYLPVQFKVNLYGENNLFSGNYEVFSESGEYLIDYENAYVYGTIYDLLSGDIDINGKISEVWLGYQRLKDVELDINVENNNININNIFNEKLKINGNYNISNQTINMNFNLDNYILYNVSGNPEFNIKVNGLNGRIFGTINNIFGYVNLNQPQVYADSKYLGVIDGNVLIDSSVVNINDMRFNDNNLNAYYNINSQELHAKLSINENNIPNIFNLEGLTLNVLSELEMKGKLSDFDLRGYFSINNPEYRGFRLPSAKTDLAYTNGDIGRFLSYGELDIPNLTFYGDNGEELLSTNANFDLSDIYLDFKLENKEFSLDSVEDLKSKGYSGDLLLNILVNGRLDDFFVDVKASSDNLELSGFLVKNLDLDFQVNNNELSLGQFYLEYEQNPLLMNGYLSFKPLDYNISLFANNFNLEFLGLDKNIKKASGIADVNILFDRGETTGTVSLNDFSYISNDGVVQLVDVNADIKVDKRKLIINNFTGGYNNGTFSLIGNIDVPTIPDDFMETKRLDLGNFELNTNFDNIGVKYGKGIDLKLTGNMIFTENNLLGKVDVNSGEIRELPDILTKTIMNKEETETESKEKTIVNGVIDEIIDKVLNQYTVNVSVQSNKDLKVKIPSFSLVKNINGSLISDLRIFYESGDLGLWGDIYVDGGSFSLNNNKFNVSQLEVLFENTGNDPLTNPYLTFRADTKIDNYRIEVSKEGYLQSSEIVLRSDTGLTREEILSLLLFNTLTNKEKENSEFNDITTEQEQNAAILTTLMDNTLNELIFSSITDRIGDTLGLTSFSINTGVTNSSGESYSSSTTVKMTNNLYKNKIFWNLEIEVPIIQSSSNKEFVELPKGDNVGNSKDNVYYDFWINYNVSNGFDVKIGGDTKNRKRFNGYGPTSSENRDNINYYIGVDFTFRDYTLGDIIKRIFNMKKMEKLTK